jgi:hypothetical protein
MGMPLAAINIGAFPNDSTGDTVRQAMVKSNANFDAIATGKANMIPTIGAMTAMTGAALAALGVFYVSGYKVVGDGGGGFFSWQPDSTATVDQVTVFGASDGVAGRAVRSAAASAALPLPLQLGGSLLPLSDNTITVGAAANRFSVAYFGTAPIVTSDEAEQQQIAAMTAAEKATALAIKGLIKSFKYNDAVTRKGDKARIHFGVLAQDVAASFTANSLDPDSYGMFCSNTWYELDGVDVLPAADGSYPAGAVAMTRLGVRYEELFAFLIGAM